MVQKNRYPQPDREVGCWLNLNGTWDFSLNNDTLDRKIEVPYPWGSPLSGISEDTNGTGYYRRTVRWNPSHDRIFLHFGAVDYTCVVFVNGKELGSHKGGYMPFCWDVTDFWNREEENTILVMAEDTGDNIVQTYGKQGYGNARGIWQTVWLEARPTAHIADFVVDTRLDGTVCYDMTLVNAVDGDIVCASFPAAGISVSSPVMDGKASLRFQIDEPQLWTPETPHLYEGTLSLGDDVISTYFGIREIGTGRFGAHDHRYITLNGKPYYLNGVLDQSFNPQGFFTLPSDDDCRDEILRLKRIGINMARIHIKAEEPLKLYWADKLGLLIMEDIPCFWGDPTANTRAQFEREMEQQIYRDRNHPSIFYWVIFNETWGLFDHLTDENGNTQQVYTTDTAKWVVECWNRVKKIDPTRLVEDNSVCCRDHTKTDVNTWHFYSNGYRQVKGIIDDFCDNAYIGSTYNYKEGYAMEDVPCMNSECGNVWGIRGSAGESDISWQYKYMMNEFRLHDTLCGFIFTEFHDVVNEFNGYYKLNNGDKDFGYDLYGMTLRDLHSQDYLGADFSPMTTVHPGDSVTVPLFGSSFTDLRHGKLLSVLWQLTVHDPLDGDYVADSGEHQVVWSGYGTFPAGEIALEMPDHDGIAMLSFALFDEDGFVMKNAVLFDIDSGRDDALVLSPAVLKGDFDHVIPAEIDKVSGLGAGTFSTVIRTADIPDLDIADDLRILAEASTRAPMTHDYPEKIVNEKVDMNYMLGYRCDPGANPNSFPQTDADLYPGKLILSIDGQVCGTFLLPDCPADSRGALSHHYQPTHDLLHEAGTYGYLCDIRIPSSVLFALKNKDSFTLTLSTDETTGLSLFGRKSGRYGIGIVLRAE